MLSPNSLLRKSGVTRSFGNHKILNLLSIAQLPPPISRWKNCTKITTQFLFLPAFMPLQYDLVASFKK